MYLIVEAYKNGSQVYRFHRTDSNIKCRLYDLKTKKYSDFIYNFPDDIFNYEEMVGVNTAYYYIISIADYMLAKSIVLTHKRKESSVFSSIVLVDSYNFDNECVYVLDDNTDNIYTIMSFIRKKWGTDSVILSSRTLYIKFYNRGWFNLEYYIGNMNKFTKALTMGGIDVYNHKCESRW